MSLLLSCGPSSDKSNGEDLSIPEKVREAANRKRSETNLKPIGLAFPNYESNSDKLPTNITDKNGKDLLSWRVAILREIEGADLYKQFKLDESWDSENNKKLISRIPKLYIPLQGEAKERETFYQSFSGKGTYLEGNIPHNVRDVPFDLSGSSAFVVEAGTPVIWT